MTWPNKVTFDKNSPLTVSDMNKLSDGINFLYTIIHPVGSILLSVDSRKPDEYIPGTTWEAWGSGRVPVGVDVNDACFRNDDIPANNQAGKEGGSKDAVVIGHNHTARIVEKDGEHCHAIFDPGHRHAIYKDAGSSQDKTTIMGSGTKSDGESSKANTSQEFTKIVLDPDSDNKPGNGGKHDHSITVNHNNDETGTSKNLQPYITCYMWKRTA